MVDKKYRINSKVDLCKLCPANFTTDDEWEILDIYDSLFRVKHAYEHLSAYGQKSLDDFMDSFDDTFEIFDDYILHLPIKETTNE